MQVHESIETPSVSLPCIENAQPVFDEYPPRVDYQATIRSGHWVYYGTSGPNLTRQSRQARISAAPRYCAAPLCCAGPHLYGEPHRCDNPDCSGTKSGICQSFCRCLLPCCACRGRRPPYPADFSKPYRSLNFWYRSTE